MKRTIALMFAVFAGVVGWHFGNKLAAESIAVIVGVVLGIFAMLPMAVLLLVVMRKAMQSQQPAQPQQPQQQPTVIVVGGQQLPPPQQQVDPWTVDGQWRPAEDKPQFRMLGEE